MTGGKPLFQAILDDPDDDGIRLIYADWLEEHGDADRAEFIRVQCELARLDGRCFRGDGKSSWCVGAPRRHSPGCPAEALRRREQELLALTCPLHPGAAHGLLNEWLTQEGWPDIDSISGAAWQRGFIESITVPAADWLANADVILAFSPIQKIVLTTWPNFVCWTRRGGGYNYRLLSEDGTKVLGEVWSSNEEVRTSTGADGVVWNEIALKRLLVTKWSGINFELPPRGVFTVPPHPSGGLLEAMRSEATLQGTPIDIHRILEDFGIKRRQP